MRLSLTTLPICFDNSPSVFNLDASAGDTTVTPIGGQLTRPGATGVLSVAPKTSTRVQVSSPTRWALVVNVVVVAWSTADGVRDAIRAANADRLRGIASESITAK